MSRLIPVLALAGFAAPAVLTGQLFERFGPPAPFATDYATDFAGHPFQLVGLDVVDDVRPVGTSTDGPGGLLFNAEALADQVFSEGILQANALFNLDAGDCIRVSFVESGGGTAGSTDVDALAVNFGAQGLNGLMGGIGDPFLVFPEVATTVDSDAFIRDPLVPGDFVEWEVGPEGAGPVDFFMIHNASILPPGDGFDPNLFNSITSNVRILELNEGGPDTDVYGIAFQEFGLDDKSEDGWNVFLLEITSGKGSGPGGAVIPEPAYGLFAVFGIASFMFLGARRRRRS